MTRWRLALAAFCFVLTSSAAQADLRPTSAAGTCLIQITNGPEGNHLAQWRSRTLTGADACVLIGQEADRNLDHAPAFPSRDACVCTGPDHGNDESRAVVLCRERKDDGAVLGPKDSKLVIWCDRCGTPIGSWKWVDNNEIFFAPGGVATHTGAKDAPGTWSQAGNKITVKWPRWNSTDTLVLSPDGRTLTGQYGKSITGTSTRASQCKR